MKSFFWLLLLIFLIHFSSYGQTELWGLTSEGGNGRGTIFKTDNNGSFLSAYGFPVDFEGEAPVYQVFDDTNDLIYGVTREGGTFNSGVLFSYNLTTSEYLKLYDFAGAMGTRPLFLQITGDMIYGITLTGGTAGRGVLFSYKISTQVYSLLHTFNAGRSPNSLSVLSDGSLLGTTSQGGTNNQGTIFTYNLGTNQFSMLHNFNSTLIGSTPQGLIDSPDGFLYGTCSSGGINNVGSIFRFDKSTNQIAKLHDFGSSTNVENPIKQLHQISNGLLYGVSLNGGMAGEGTIFHYDISTSTLTKVHDFIGFNGRQPRTSLFQASNGVLYGTTSRGGASGRGTIYQFNPTTETHNTIHNFNSNHSFSQKGTILEISNDYLIGITSGGGKTQVGTIYQYDLSNSIFQYLIDFSQGTYGLTPSGPLIAPSNDFIYGTAASGGSLGNGVIFAFDAINGVFTSECSFVGSNGDSPNSGLIQTADNNLYGTTRRGGNTNQGTIFEYEKGTNKITSLHHFDGTNTGQEPLGLTKGQGGILYGVTANGGANGSGTLFSFNTITNQLVKLIDFESSSSGSSPSGPLTEISNDTLYGVNLLGGSNNFGTLYQYTISTNTLTVLLNFQGVNGRSPSGKLVVANGLIFGTTTSGGSTNRGTIYTYDPISETQNSFFTFNSFDGSRPSSGLTISPNGLLYGTTSLGGTSQKGTIFEVNPSTLNHSVKVNFNGSNGSLPLDGGLVIIDPTILPVSLLHLSAKEDLQGIAMHWQTANETNNAFFTLEHSQDALEWRILAKVTGNGTSSQINSYHYTDKAPFIGTNYYRLSQTDFDGTTEVLQTIRVNHLFEELELYPNPVSNYLHLSANFGTKPEILIYSLDGKELSSNIKILKSNGEAKIQTTALNPGLYRLMVNGRSYRFIKK